VRITDNCATGTQNHGTLSASGSPGGAAYVTNNYDPGNAYQKWSVQQNTATGALTITNTATGLALDGPGGSTGSATATALNSPSGAASQTWTTLS
jgi:alpha-galactosidase